MLHWAALLAYLAWALGGASLLCWRFGRRAAPGFLRTGLMLVGAGTTIGFGYIALKVAVLMAWFSSPSIELVRTDAVLESIILATAIGLIATGCMWEPLSSRGVAAVDAVRDWRSLRRLYPLWQALGDAVPSIVLAQENAKPPGTRPSPRHLRLQLVRRVVEIRDGQLALRPYADPATASAAQMAVDRAGYRRGGGTGGRRGMLGGVSPTGEVGGVWGGPPRCGVVRRHTGPAGGSGVAGEGCARGATLTRGAAIAEESVYRMSVGQDAS